MNTKGFKRFDSLRDYTPLPSDPSPKVEDPVKSPTDLILDQIFSLDVNGWPRTSLAAMLSDKTSADVRKYIEDNILVATQDKSLIGDADIVQKFKDLDSEFIATMSRDRFETVQQYEARINDYIERQKTEMTFKKRYEDFKKKLDGKE